MSRNGTHSTATEQNAEAIERSILGACLVWPEEVWPAVHAAISEVQFASETHRLIYHAMSDAVEKTPNGRLDLGLLTQELRIAGLVGAKGRVKPSDLAALPQSVAPRANLEEYVRRFLENFQRRTGEDPDLWPEISPLGSVRLPSFPIGALPPILARFVAEEAEATQTPLALAAMSCLAVCAAAVARKLRVEIRPGWREPLNLFTCTVLPPGTRKSRVNADACEPLELFEMDERRMRLPSVSAARAMKEVLEGQAKAAKKKAASAVGGERAQALAERAVEATREWEDFLVPALPRLITDDATPEQLVFMMAEQGGRIAVFSAEGTVFEQMAGRYNQNGSGNLEVYLQSWNGETIRIDRRSRPEIILTEPALTLGLCVQPDVIEVMSKKPGMLGRGMFGRFLYAMPDSGLGARRVGADPVAYQTRQDYRNLVSRLLAFPGADPSFVAPFSAHAREAFEDFERWLEPKLDRHGELGGMTDWAGKLAGNTARIAGVIQAVSSTGRHSLDGAEVGLEAVAAAVQIAQFCIPHAKAVYFGMGQDPKLAAAKYVLEWIQREGRQQFSRRELHQACRSRFPSARQLAEPLAILTECGYIRAFETSVKRQIGRPSRKFSVNPKAYAFESFECV